MRSDCCEISLLPDPKAEILLDLPWKEYIVRPWLGSSALDDWQAMGCEAWADRWLREGGYSDGKSSTDSMTAGSSLDALVTGTKEDFAKRFAVKPAGMKLSTKEGKAWAEENAFREILEAETKAEIDASFPRVQEAIAVTTADGENPVFQATLRGEVGGQKVQTRPDIYYQNAKHFQDLKYVNSKSFASFDRDFVRSRYLLQAGLFYGLAMDAGIEDPTVSFLLVESGTRFPRVRDVGIPAWVLEVAWRKVRTICEEIARTEESGMIDAVRFSMLELPAWAEKELGA